ncbi:MAG TPA: GNAT family N-acetyltransferase [Terriglobia bacterium]|nr:GNAT family N-acetyltransferase [Terriglobia bacterium]
MKPSPGATQRQPAAEHDPESGSAARSDAPPPILGEILREPSHGSADRSPAIHSLNPLEDSRWDSLLERHPQASVFHSRPWLEALRRCYGYTPIALTPSPPGMPLKAALLACVVDSWLTGRRLVSLPFSDHCDPLLERPEQLAVFSAFLEKRLREEQWRYIELRPANPLAGPSPLCQAVGSYCWHRLDLAPDIGALFRNLHKDSTQRKIKRAQREGLLCEAGASEELLRHFYRLQLLTRRRHGLPPQPPSWFRRLAECFGADLKIRVAFQERQPAAAILTLRFQNTLVYKYGCSDPKFHHLGAMHLLLWKAIEEAKQAGLRMFDLGRSDYDNPGLITFKDRWGAARQELTYYRYLHPAGARASSPSFTKGWKARLARKTAPLLPDRVLAALGTLLYRHLG